MATKATTGFLNIVEAAQRLGPDGRQARIIAELLVEMNELMLDAAMQEANDQWSHMVHRRSRYPTISPRTINLGATRTSSAVQRYREQMVLLEPWVEIDERLLSAQPDRQAFMQDEFSVYAEAAIQEFVRIWLYGNPGTDSREVQGVLERWKALADLNVIGIGGTGDDLTSLLLVEWGDMVNYLIYPRGHGSVGIKEENLGRQRITDANNNPYMAHSYHATLEFGLAVPDDVAAHQAVQRLANIESTGASNNLLDTNKVRELHYARNRLWHQGRNAVIYGNRDVKSQLDIYADEKANGFQTFQDQETKEPITKWRGIPVRMLEQLSSAESALT